MRRDARGPRSASAHAFVSATARIGKGQHSPGDACRCRSDDRRELRYLPGAVIGRECRLGDHVTIYPNAVLYDDVVIGNRVRIHASAVIGADGFGYRTGQRPSRMDPPFGRVRIEDDVDIGAGTTIDRAMIDETVIGAAPSSTTR